MRVVIGKRDIVMWNVKFGKRCRVLDSYTYNGEGWYKLECIKTGEKFDSPDVFWK